MVCDNRTGKRISVSVLPEVLIRSVMQRPRQHRMLRSLRSMSLRQRKEFGRPEGSTLLMAALESCKGVLNAFGGMSVF